MLWESEMQLSRDLAVSRGSVREAYRILAALGVLEIGNGRRPRIHAVNPIALTQIFTHALHIAHATPLHVLEFRRGIEVHGAQLAARFATEAQIAKLRSLIREMRASLHDEARRVASDMAVHTTLAEASNNPLNSLVLTALHTAISQSLRQDHLNSAAMTRSSGSPMPTKPSSTECALGIQSARVPRCPAISTYQSTRCFATLSHRR